MLGIIGVALPKRTSFFIQSPFPDLLLKTEMKNWVEDLVGTFRESILMTKSFALEWSSILYCKM